MKRRNFLKGSFFFGVASMFGFHVEPVHSITINKGPSVGMTTEIARYKESEKFAAFVDAIVDNICRVQQTPKEIFTRDIDVLYLENKIKDINAR